MSKQTKKVHTTSVKRSRSSQHMTRDDVRQLAKSTFEVADQEIEVDVTGVRDPVDERFTAFVTFGSSNSCYQCSDYARTLEENKLQFLVNRETAGEAWDELAERINAYKLAEATAAGTIACALDRIMKVMTQYPRAPMLFADIDEREDQATRLQFCINAAKFMAKSVESDDEDWQ